jgi:hypothetical protein
MKKSIQFLAVAGMFLLSTAGVSAQTGAYSGPAGAPPTVNVAAPINVGPASQTKAGLLRVNGGLYNAGTSVFERRVEIGVDPCYGVPAVGGCGPTSGGGSSASAPSSFIERLASSIVPKTASAVGTPSTDILHVYGNASFTGGAVTIGGKNICLQDGTNCGGTAAAQWTAGVGTTGSANIFRPTGKVGIGLPNTVAPVTTLELRGGEAQLSLGQTATNRWKLWGGSNLHFRKNDDSDVLFLGSDGKVGVGTTSPSAKFTVAGDGKIGNVELVDNQGGSIELGAGGSSTTPFIDFRGNGGHTSDFNARIINNANGELSFQNAGGTKMQMVNTSQSVVVTNAVPVYRAGKSSGASGCGTATDNVIDNLGPLTLNANTCGNSNTLLGYLLPPPPSAGPSVGPVPTVTGLGTSGYGGHAVGATLITINFDGRYTSTTPLNRVGAEVRIASTGAYIGAGHNPATTYDFSGSTYSSPAGTNVNFSVPGANINCGVNYQWRIWARNSSGIGYGSWMTYFIAC